MSEINGKRQTDEDIHVQRLCPFCVVGLEGHGMAGMGIGVSGHRCRMFKSLG